MSTPTSTMPGERPGFFDGQLLAAADLQDLEAYGSDLRHLHNRSLHQPGIGSGFAVAGAKGDREVVVGPGYAIDAEGREIVLTEEERQAVPAVASELDGRSVFFDLTISYADASALKEAETRDGTCLPRGAVRYVEAPEFCWVRLERGDAGGLKPVDPQLGLDIKAGMRIRLARAEILNCELRSAVAVEQRREARPRQLPYVVAGVAEPAWQPWEGSTGGLDLPIEITRDIVFAFRQPVDTCAAAFESTPWYAAHVVADRILEVRPQDKPVERFLLVDQVHVQDATPDSFTAFLAVAIVPIERPVVIEDPALIMDAIEVDDAVPAAASAVVSLHRDATGAAAKLIQTTWRLSWMGVEP